MGKPTLLLFNLDGSRREKIRLNAMRFKILIREVKKQEFGRSLGALCGLTEPEDTANTGADFDDELIVMANFSQILLNQFLNSFRTMKIPPVRLKAILTPTNAKWTPAALREELMREREAIKNSLKSPHEKTEAEAPKPS